MTSTRTTIVLETVKEDPHRDSEGAGQGVNLAYLSFVTVCVIWGTTYLGIHVALETSCSAGRGPAMDGGGVIMSGLMLATGRGCRSPGWLRSPSSGSS